MFALRCTESLLARIVAEEAASVIAERPPLPDTLLGDWHLERLGNDRILCTSAVSLLSVVIAAEPFADLPSRLRTAVAELLDVIGVPRPKVERELKQMRWAQFAPANDTRVHDAMDRLLVAAHADAASDAPAASDVELAVKLGAVPVGSPYLGQGIPVRAAQLLFGLPPETRGVMEALADDWIEGASPD